MHCARKGSSPQGRDLGGLGSRAGVPLEQSAGGRRQASSARSGAAGCATHFDLLACEEQRSRGSVIGTVLPAGETQAHIIHMERPMAKEPKQLDELFHDTLKDIYFAEKKILATLPKMAKAAQSEELKAAFEKHMGETEGQIERLEKVFAAIDKKPQGKTCAAIVGITDEGAEIMEEYKGSPALDAGLLAAAQAVEHYEISRYGTLIAWAEELGYDDAVSLLEETLEEEEATDEALTEIAKTAINQEAKAAA
jgi:ferritin-like metal-binding protein YciE